MNRYEPLISILVPCYNNQKYIYALLESVFAQTYRNIEVLIGDDGSEQFDARSLVSWITAHSHEGMHVAVFESEVNRGTVANFEHLQEKARGEWLFHIAADDVLYDKTVMQCFVDRLNALMQQGKKPEVIMAQLEMWNQELTQKMGNFISAKNVRLLESGSPKEIFAESCQHCWLPPQFLYHRSVLDKVGKLSEQYRLIEDWPMALRLSHQGVRFEYMNEVPSAKHRHGGISHGNSVNSKRVFLQYYKELIEVFYHEVQPYPDMISEQVYREVHIRALDRINALRSIYIPEYKQLMEKTDDRVSNEGQEHVKEIQDIGIKELVKQLLSAVKARIKSPLKQFSRFRLIVPFAMVSALCMAGWASMGQHGSWTLDVLRMLLLLGGLGCGMVASFGAALKVYLLRKYGAQR